MDRIEKDSTQLATKEEANGLRAEAFAMSFAPSNWPPDVGSEQPPKPYLPGITYKVPDTVAPDVGSESAPNRYLPGLSFRPPAVNHPTDVGSDKGPNS
jgi:hypothetical protein